MALALPALSSASSSFLQHNFTGNPKGPTQLPNNNHSSTFLVFAQKKAKKTRKIILKEDVPEVGKKGQLLDVKAGFYRNYLLPTGKAQIVTPLLLKEMKIEGERIEAEKRWVKEEAQLLALIFETVGAFKVKRNGGKGKQIFGSVTAQDLVDIIKAQLQRSVDSFGCVTIQRILESLLEIFQTGCALHYISHLPLRDVDKRIVDLPQIRGTGEYVAELKLHPEVTARVRLNVYANCAQICFEVPYGEWTFGASNLHQFKRWVIWVCSFNVPMAPGKTRSIVCSARNFFQFTVPGPARWQVVPRWYEHWTSNKVYDGDMIILQGQEKIFLSDAKDGGDINKQYTNITFTPTQADRFVLAFRNWLRQHGNGQPEWFGASSQQQLPSTVLSNCQMLDRFEQHTLKCSSCKGAHEAFQTWQKILIGATVLFCATSGIPSETHLRTLLAWLAILSAGLAYVITELQKNFVFVDYVHAEID